MADAGKWCQKVKIDFVGSGGEPQTPLANALTQKPLL
jgi:hypothetical protein